MSILLCDSNCELWYTRLEELKLDYISMPYLYGGEQYNYDLGKNTDFKKFFSAVRSGTVPKTMALNPEDYKEILSPYFKKGEDVIYISFSHAMSGTFAQLDKALEELKIEFPDRKCTVFNTNSISLGAGIQVEAAAELKLKGASDGEILEFLKDFTNRVSVYFVVDDLMHLKRGGRLSGAAAVAGTLLGLKPLITFNAQGGLSVIEKIVGRKKVIKNIANKVINNITGKEYGVYVVDADCKEDGDELARVLSEALPDVKIKRQPVGPVIGSHCGPGTLGVIFISDKRPIALEGNE
ncbi:MAG: DegV family protein [Clostridia bacterium]|jgi:DegV family protein with EDD domain|nr:DegV family protein [Clostridia bacterium]